MAGSFHSSALFKFLLAALMCSALSGAKIRLENQTPVFAGPDLFSQRLGILPGGTYAAVGAPERHFSVRHPIAFYVPFVKLRQGGFVSPEVTVDGHWENAFLPPRNDWRLPGASLASALLAVLLFFFIRGKLRRTIAPDSWRESAGFILIAVLVRQILLLCEIGFWNNAIPCAADEPGYFKVVYDLLRGDFSGPWNFTVGLGLIYLPFVLLTGARDYYDIAVSFCHFNGLVFGPAALAAAFLVLKNFRIGSKCAFAAVLLWAVYPFFIFHTELWNSLRFGPMPALPCFLEGVPDWWRYYSVCIHTGFNGMSDTPGLLAVLLTVLLAQRAPARLRSVFFTGLAFGFCCLVRINYIFFAPVLAFIWYLRLPGEPWARLFRCAGAAAAGFLLVFGWQFLVNIHHFGHPFTFGYSLHYLDFPPEKRPAAGFTWAVLAEMRNIRFLMGANKLVMLAGIGGLLFLRERYTRAALTLFAVPLILFFFGYSHTYCDARRFIMAAYPLFLGGFCAACAGAFAAFRQPGKEKLLLPGLALFLGTFFFLPAAVYASALFLLLLRAFFDLQREVSEVILRK